MQFIENMTSFLLVRINLQLSGAKEHKETKEKYKKVNFIVLFFLLLLLFIIIYSLIVRNLSFCVKL